MILFQRGGVLQPGREILLKARREIQQILKTVSRIGDMRPGDQLDLTDLASIDVDMRNVLRVGSKLGSITGNPVIESGTDGDEKIAVFDSVVRVRCTVHTEHV